MSVPLNLARIRSTLSEHEAALKEANAAEAAAYAARDAAADAADETARRLRQSDRSLDVIAKDHLFQLVEAAELLREVLPSVDFGQVGHRQSDPHIPMGCDCARCRACELLGEAR